MTADLTNLYIANASFGGVIAIDKATGAPRGLSSQSAWHVAVDADGVYWGDHDVGSPQGTAGAIWMHPKR